ncbi:DUF4163 domain-containing protein [Sphingomonas sp. BN140010]|uniref:DUF4163 domain-containing protein n=1 Tax=Sphingomonas arvum TaxID=2992113 RepID=A0ABT3JCQ4_9SPHN|nr:DUF4163 domain-containing protein [Sphingomonas sp. BN140010]MCW3796842.1 DUF4163 domain-containing protein [Sphingomonas sp. BN140010]
MLLLLAAAVATTIASKDKYLDFSYKWSTEAAAVTALDRRFRTDAAQQRRRYAVMARQDPRLPYAFDRSWTTAGAGTRLLSLSSLTYSFTGGAHGNTGIKSLLWDRRLAREVTLNTLLQRSGWWDGAIRQPFCTLLDRERTKRRQEPVKRSDLFGDCPPLKDVSLVLADSNKNGRFDRVLVIADPYVAGPYAEGSYEIGLPLTAAMLARLKPEYRSSFEPQPPVQ